MKKLTFITRFKMGFLLPFTDCRKVIGKMSVICGALRDLVPFYK